MGQIQMHTLDSRFNSDSPGDLDNLTLILRQRERVRDEQRFRRDFNKGFVQALDEEADELDLELDGWHLIEEPLTSADWGSSALNITQAASQHSPQPIPFVTLPPHGPVLPPSTETYHSRQPESIPLPVSQQSSLQPTTTTDHSVTTSESRSSSLSSETSNPHRRSRNMAAKEEDLYDRLRRLSAEAINLRLKLDSLRTKQSELARDYDEGEQSTLKSLRVAYSQSSFEGGSKITLDRKFFLEIIGYFSERRDEFGPLLEQMREYELNLLRTEYQLRQVEERLHELYVEEKPQAAEVGQSYEMTGGVDRGMPRRHSVAAENEGEEAWDEESNEPQEFQEYDPSSLDPTLVEWQKQYVEMEHLQENLLYFARQEAKLRDQKQQRENKQLHISEHESVILHLSPEDEERLKKLADKVLELEAELKEGLKLLAKLREKCLKAGIDENDVPTVPMHTDEEDVKGEEEHGHADVVAVEPTDFEEWVITPAKDTKKRRWLRATARQQEVSGESVAKELKGLEAPGSLKNAAEALGRHQLQQVEAVPQMKNSTEPDERYEWVLAHLDRSSIRVFVKRVLKQDSQSAEEKQIAVKDEASQNEEYSSTVGGAISDTSGLPQMATYADHSLVNTWLFTKLGHSIMEVRLLGTVLEIKGIPMLEETAFMVMKYWNTDLEVPKDRRMAADVFDGWWGRIDAFLKQEGYDHGLAQQLEKAEWEPSIVERREDESGGAESGYNSRGVAVSSK